ncbi:MAG TPA: DUF6518 family protein [Gaiellales bacterium]|jgi:hypothetical protein
MSGAATPSLERAPRAPVSPAACGALVLLLGLGVGVATSLLQARLGTPWAGLANAASPWITPAFVAGTLWRRPSTAALAGLAACLLELVGYYATTDARGYPVSHSELVFWGVCAVVGGPIFGAAGWAWWRGPYRLRGLGAALLAAAFGAEALVSYGWRLHYTSTAILFAAIGVGAALLLGIHRREHLRVALWLLAALPAGIVAEVVLGLVYRQSF